MMASPTSATATTTTEEATTTPPEGLELSSQPVLRERQITISQTPINQTHVLFTDSGNGTITLPNTTEAINFTGTDSVVASIVDGTAVGKEVFTTLDGSETVNGTVFAMARFNMQEGTGKGIVTLLLQTNSTGRLAPVNGMILVGHIEFSPDGSAESTMWEWQSGVPLPPSLLLFKTLLLLQWRHRQQQMLLLMIPPLMLRHLRKEEKEENNSSNKQQ
jgi:inner membrane protein involved in colicin E2 resistance